MDLPSFLFFLFYSILLFACFHFTKSIIDTVQPRSRRLPPGPSFLALIRNIHHLIHNPHKALAKLAQIHGPLMHLKLGFVDMIVVSSPELAREVLEKHDQVLSYRPYSAVSYVYNHHKLGLEYLPPADKWRSQRKICNDHMLSPNKLDESQGLRREKFDKLREFVQESSNLGQVVDIADAAFTTTLNIISASLFSIDFATLGSDSCQEFKVLIRVLLKNITSPNLADYFPFLKPIDPQGIKQKGETYMRKIFKIFDEIIDRRLEESGDSDVLQAMLKATNKKESKFTREDMLHLLLVLFVAGSETTSTAIEWVMAELIKNPTKMKKAQNELLTVVGKTRYVQESDIPDLPYLQCVIKEILRLHPVAPLLLPHKAEVDVDINGYTLPKNAQILVNIWAIGRDSGIWPEPDTFMPERFLDRKIDIKGKDFILIPFGSGRRICPGMPLALRMVPLVVAELIKEFDWKLENGASREEMNMEERFGLVLFKAVHLKAIPVKL